jgi:hypothetical protein
MVTLDVGYESFLAPEMFFHPVSITFNSLVVGIYPQGLCEATGGSG